MPSIQRGPVISRSTAGPDQGSTSTRSTPTRSAISGSSSSPPRPTTSTGNPAARSAAATPAMSLRRRTSTALVGGCSPAPAAACHRVAMPAATHASSSTTVSNRPYATWPSGADGRARSSPTGTAPSAVRTGRDASLATSSTRRALRKLVSSGSDRAGVPGHTGKSVGNRGRFDALAPRQE